MGEVVLRQMVSSVFEECVAAKVPELTLELVAAAVRGVALNPSLGINLDEQLKPEDVDRIAALATSVLQSGTPTVSTLRAQTFFANNYRSLDVVASDRRQALLNVIREVEDSILEMRARTRDQLEGLYRQIVSSILLRSNMGSPSDITVVKETTAALGSVMPPEELGSFMRLTTHEKRRQLEELGLIVMGIRLFNKHSGKGGDAIPNLPLELGAIIKDLVDTTASLHDKLATQARVHTALLLRQDMRLEGEDRERIEQFCYNARQHIFYISLLQNDVTVIADRLSTTKTQFAMRRERLQATVHSQAAVATDQVFPQFMELASLWQAFQELSAQLTMVSKVIGALGSTATLDGDVAVGVDIPSFLQDAVSHEQELFARACAVSRSLVSGEPVPHQAEQFAPTEAPLTAAEVTPTDELTKLLVAESTHDLDNIPLQFAGYCVTTYAHTGAIVPVIRTLGLIQRGNACYGFATRAAATEFASDPDTVLSHAMARAQVHPECVELLHLHGSTGASVASLSAESVAVKCDSGCQTVLHPIETHVDKSYEWNEWELRRKALKLANLRTKKTHSTQTHNSNFRRANATQVYLPKEKPTQTRADAYTNTSKPVTYIRGLRGARGPKATPHQVVDLTLQVGGIALEPKGQKKKGLL
eukprot:m.356638 g.356638  ORF g.356638 m.356638 type:complete len:647 (+) comp17594_c0_seq1:137-2077(+)